MGRKRRSALGRTHAKGIDVRRFEKPSRGGTRHTLEATRNRPKTGARWTLGVSRRPLRLHPANKQGAGKSPGPVPLFRAWGPLSKSSLRARQDRFLSVEEVFKQRTVVDQRLP